MAQDNSSTGNTGGPPSRVDEIIEKGLEKYGEGDLLGALNEWEHALQIDPGAQRAIEYTDYVRENFDVLSEKFLEARAVARNADDQGVPITEAVNDPDAYDSMELEQPEIQGSDGWGFDDVAPLPPPPDTSLDDDLAAVNAGLDEVNSSPAGFVDDLTAEEATTGDIGDEPAQEMEAELPDELTFVPDGGEPRPAWNFGGDEAGTLDLSDRLEPAPDAQFSDMPAAGTRPPVLTIRPRTGGTMPGDLPAPPAMAMPPELDPELDRALEHTPSPELISRQDQGRDGDRARLRLTRASTTPGVDLGEDTSEGTRPHVRGLGGEHEDAPTRERHVSGLGDPFADLDLGPSTGGTGVGLEFDDQPQTSERIPFGKGKLPGLVPPAPKPGASPAVIIDEQLLRAYDDIGGDAERTTDYGVEGPLSAAATLPTQETAAIPGDARTRIEMLLGKAQACAERGDFRAAVDLVEAASLDDPDGAIIGELVGKTSGLLFRIYEGHLGDPTQVPTVAVPLHEVAAQHLDHRTGFLLSRIDGMLTYEDILDIAGMPRLEAYKILSHLLRNGVIEVR